MGAKVIKMGSFNRQHWLCTTDGFVGKLRPSRYLKSILQVPQTKVNNGHVTCENMEENKECISRPVRVRFKKSNETVEGNIIFYLMLNRPILLTRSLTILKFRLNDAQKTETSFSLMDVDMIDYL